MDKDLQICKHPPVDLERAIQIVEEYCSRSTTQFEDAEQAIAETMFGFSRSESEFIEIGINGPEQISYKFEYADPDASWLRTVFGGTFQFEKELRSKAELIQRVQEFFELTPVAIKVKLQKAK
jgi:hypothetical protein